MLSNDSTEIPDGVYAARAVLSVWDTDRIRALEVEAGKHGYELHPNRRMPGGWFLVRPNATSGCAVFGLDEVETYLNSTFETTGRV